MQKAAPFNPLSGADAPKKQMTRRSQLNFRLSPEEINEFKTIAQIFGMNPTDYFRAKFLDHTGGDQTHPLISTDELERRGKLAEKILRQREIEKIPEVNRLALLHYSNLINIRIDEIATYISSRLSSSCSPNDDVIIKKLSEIQRYIDGKYPI